MRSVIITLALATIVNVATAQLRLPAIIGSGMVLQQNDSAALWGWAGPGGRVYVTTGWNKHTDSVVADNSARWKLKVKTPAAGGPYKITIRSGNTIELDNVMIGEVWVCSGQSNMEWSYYNGAKDIRPELANAPNNNIRFFHVPKTGAAWPQDDVKAQWTICDSNTLKSFSAVGYFFGKKLQEHLKVPIGLINSSWGGTPAETWTPSELVEKDAMLKEAAGKLTSFAWWPDKAGVAYNAMIWPLVSYNIAGAIWYQGESNTGTHSTYSRLLTTMIDGWRAAWKKPLPFYYVQIAPFKYGNNNIGALVQEQQTKTMLHPGTGMVVVTDLIDSVTNIHPSMKHEVGYRLANWALAETYKQPGIAYKSPSYKSMEQKAGKLVLSFDNVPNGLVVKDKQVTGFYISGDTESWVPAEAKIEKDKIVLWNRQLKDPKQVRYGFSNTIMGNVLSAEGLPIIPFRTDNWPVDQSAVK
jgi:sialate O-acetylesterase